jgi:uncharacterized protein YndB with AHSA1/START domain
MQKEITLSRTLATTPEYAWEAWTDPSKVSQWWGPKGFSIPACDIDLRIGGNLHIVMKAGESLGPMAGMEFPMTGVFTEIIPPEKLVFTNNALDAEGNTLLSGTTTVTFESVGDDTKVTVSTGAEGTAPGVEQMLGGMEQGWNEQLDKLAEFVKG